MNALKASFGCLFIALALNAAFCCFAQTLAPAALAQDIPWLKINSRKIPGDKEIHPERTEIITTFEPIVSQVGDKKWRISFNIFN